MKFVKALPITLLYLVAGMLCLYLSDKLTVLFFPEQPRGAFPQLVKNFLFVFCTALLLYLVLSRFIKKYNRLNSEGQHQPGYESQLELLFQVSPLAHILFEAGTGKVFSVNQRAMDMLGQTREKLVGHNIFILMDVLSVLKNNNNLHNDNRRHILAYTKTDQTSLILEVSFFLFKGEGRNCILLSCTDVTEREQAMCTLADLQDKLIAAQTIAKIGYWQYNFNTGKMFWSDEVYEIWGVDKHSFEPGYTTFLNSVHPDDRMLFPAPASLSDIEFNGYDMEHRIYAADGNLKWVHGKGILKKNTAGQAEYLEGTVQDITSQKLMSISLQQNLERYDYVTKAVSDIIWDWDIQTNTVVWSTGQSESLLHLGISGAAETQWEDHIITEDRKKVLEGLKDSINSGAAFWNDEYRCFTHKGAYLFVKSRAYILRDNGGNAVRLIGATSDITEVKRKALRNELKSAISSAFQSENKLKDALHAVLRSIRAIGNFDLAEVWIVGNGKQLINLVAFSAADNIEEKFYPPLSGFLQFEKGCGMPGVCWQSGEILHWESLATDVRFRRNRYAKDAGITSMYAIPLSHNNDIKGVVMLGLTGDNVESRLFPALLDSFDSDLASEISRKQAEEELSQLFDFVPDIICIAGIDGFLRKINPAMSTILGYTEQELLSHPITYFVYPEDREHTIEQINHLKKGNPVVYFENRFMTPDGSLKWIAWTATAPSSEGLVFSVAKDITEKKELELLLDKATSLAKIGAWEIDLINQEIHWSSMTRQIHGISDETYNPNFEEAMAFYKEGAYRDAIIARVTMAVENGKKWDLESQIITRQNEVKWVRSVGEPQYVNGACVRLVGSLQDIDLIKKNQLAATEALREKEMILERIGDAFFAVDLSWKVTYWNSKAEYLLGRKREDIINRNLWEVYADAVNTPFYHNYLEAMKTGQSRYFQAYYEGTRSWFDVGAFPSATGLSIFFRDITEQVSYVSSIEQYNKTLKDIAWSQSHEVRAPLARLLGLAALIKDTEINISAELQEILDMIVDAVHDLDAIVKKINQKTQVN